jgi:hypothetical protein
MQVSDGITKSWSVGDLCLGHDQLGPADLTFPTVLEPS